MTSIIGDLLTTDQVAVRLGVSPRTVTRYVETGRLKAHARLPGGRGTLLYEPEEVARLAEGRKQEMAGVIASAFREAADDWDRDEYPPPLIGGTKVWDVGRWLRDRADSIEATDSIKE